MPNLFDKKKFDLTKPFEAELKKMRDKLATIGGPGYSGYSGTKKSIKHYSKGGTGYNEAYRDWKLGVAETKAKELGVTPAQLVTNPQLATDPEAAAKYTGGTYKGISYAVGTEEWKKIQDPSAGYASVKKDPITGKTYASSAGVEREGGAKWWGKINGQTQFFPNQQAALDAGATQTGPARYLSSQPRGEGGAKTSSYTGPSIVDYLKSVGQSSSYSDRSKLAEQYGITDYRGSAQQNTELLQKLRAGTKPSGEVGAKQRQMRTGSGGYQEMFDEGVWRPVEGAQRTNPQTGNLERYNPLGEWVLVSTGKSYEDSKETVSTSDKVREEEDQEIIDKDKEAADLTLDQDKEIEKLTKEQQLKNLRTELGLDPDTGVKKPAVPTYTSDFEALRSEHGIEAIETRLTQLNKDIADLEASARAGMYDEEGRLAPMEVIGTHQREIARQAQEQLDTLNRSKSVLIDELNTKNSLISNLMTLSKLDYDTASAAYNTSFNQQISLINILEGRDTKEDQEANRVRDDARANLNIMMDATKDSGQSWDDLDLDTKNLFTKEAMKAGIDPAIFKTTLTAIKPEEKIVNTSTGTDPDGRQFVAMITRDKDGNFDIKKVYTGGVETTGVGAITSLDDLAKSGYERRGAKDGGWDFYQNGKAITAEEIVQQTGVALSVLLAGSRNPSDLLKLKGADEFGEATASDERKALSWVNAKEDLTPEQKEEQIEMMKTDKDFLNWVLGQIEIGL